MTLMKKRKLVTISLIVLLLLSVVVAAPKAEAAGAYTVALTGTDGKNVISAKPGDTVTLLLTVENNPGIVSLGVNISYPSGLSVAAHEVPADATAKMKGEGKFTPNITVTENNPFVFYMNQATGTTEKKLVTYNGTLYQIKFKVADNTSGDYKINLSARAGTNYTSDVDGSGKIIDTSVKTVDSIHMAGCTVRVENSCTNHQFGSWADAGNGKHKRTCKTCSAPETADHTWNGGAVTKQPSCKENGTKTYTCTACNATKTQSIEKTKEHSFGGWVNAGNEKHSRTCSVCKTAQTASHTWNSGSVTKTPTCKTEGVKNYTCTTCRATKNQAVAKLNNHTYDNTCDISCNVCGTTRTITHKYQTEWRTDKAQHWHQCSVCDDKKDSASHTPGPAATETKAQTCTVCDYVITPARNHKCEFSDSWTTDETGHYHACDGCEERDSYAKHVFDNACDPNCATCGYVRQINHVYDTKWTSDKENHWYACTVCGEKKDKAKHEFYVEATGDGVKTCSVCSYKTAPALEGVTGETTLPAETQTATTPPKYEANTEDLQIQLLGIVALIVLGVAVAALIFHLLIKKRSETM